MSFYTFPHHILKPSYLRHAWSWCGKGSVSDKGERAKWDWEMLVCDIGPCGGEREGRWDRESLRLHWNSKKLFFSKSNRELLRQRCSSKELWILQESVCFSMHVHSVCLRASLEVGLCVNGEFSQLYSLVRDLRSACSWLPKITPFAA